MSAFAIFDRQQLKFAYPQGWETDESDVDSSPQSVSLYGPPGVFWQVIVHTPPANPTDTAQKIITEMRAEYPDLEAFPHSGNKLPSETLGFGLNFICLDLVISGRLRTFSQPGRSLVLLYQAEDRDFEQFEQVFEAITHSLLHPESMPADAEYEA